jgi:hypothetical protein
MRIGKKGRSPYSNFRVDNSVGVDGRHRGKRCNYDGSVQKELG